MNRWVDMYIDELILIHRYPQILHVLVCSQQATTVNPYLPVPGSRTRQVKDNHFGDFKNLTLWDFQPVKTKKVFSFKTFKLSQ